MIISVSLNLFGKKNDSVCFLDLDATILAVMAGNVDANFDK